MALTVSMTTDPTTNIAIATMTGDAGDDDLIADIADDDHLVVDITGTHHLSTQYLAQLLDHTPERVIIVHPTERARSRLASSLSEARQLDNSSKPNTSTSPKEVHPNAHHDRRRRHRTLHRNHQHRTPTVR